MYTYNIFDDMVKLRSVFDDFFNERRENEGNTEFQPIRII